MAEPFIAEIRIFPYNRVPRGWLPCEGQVLSIANNQALFSLLGTTYGGNGTTTFALPDLRGRVPVHAYTQVQQGQAVGEESHVLSVNEMPAHNHTAMAGSSAGTSSRPADKVWGVSTVSSFSASAASQMNADAVGTTGGGKAHSNMQPYTVLLFCIAVEGIYPPRN
ncbi:phage tail protein [Paenibacillus tarimensis]